MVDVRLITGQILATMSRPAATRFRTPAAIDAEPGFALPVVLTMLLLLSLLAAAGHALSTLELRTSEAHRYAVATFYRADGTLQEYLGTLRGSPDPVTFSFPDGDATVSARRLLEVPGGRSLFRIDSRATVLAPPDDRPVRRAVGTVAWTGARARPPGALVVSGTLGTGGGSGRVDGSDEAGAAGCPPPGPLAGLAVLAEDPPAPPGGLVVQGDPPVLALSDAAALRDTFGLQWAEMLATFGSEATAILPADPWPQVASEGAGEGWPVIRIEGPYGLDASHGGRGAILADGDLELAAGFAWDGLILVDGHLTLAGPVRIRGAVAAGLGILAGRASGDVTLSGSGVDLRFHSCHAAAAAEALALPPAARPGTWFEEMEAWF